jgi:acid phosphatase type 7
MHRVKGSRLGVAAGLVSLALLATPLAERAGAESRVTLRPATGLAGSRVSLLGRDLGRRDPVVVRVGNEVVARTRTSRRRSFRASFAVPNLRPGKWRVVSRSKGRRIVNVFRVVASSSSARPVGEVASRRGRRVRWTPGEGSSGSEVRLEGARFPPERSLRIRFGGVDAGRARTGRRGRFSTRLTVPALGAGRRLVRVKLRSRALGFMFTITGTGSETDGASPGVASGVTPEGLTGDPVIAAAGDIACDPTFTYFRNGLGDTNRCRQKYTSDLLLAAPLSAVLALGDIQYECASSSAFTRSYGPSWGRVKAITRPAPGNHEYRTSGGSGCDTSGNARGYFGYFGAAAGDPAKGYYSFDIGSWHLIALNSNCSVVSCGSSSAQVQWLRQDLASHPARCTLGYWHHPRFTSGTNSPGSSSVTPLYQALYDYGADVVLVGHDHHYERFAPQGPNGAKDLARGIREFLVGTGGRGFHPLQTPRPNSEVRRNDTFGVLKLTLRPASYDWQFVPEAGKSFSDAGSQACH